MTENYSVSNHPKDYVGKRALLETLWAVGLSWQLGEYQILEVSPSMQYTKIRGLSGYTYWIESSNIRIVEILPPEPEQ